jgi:threonine synthase
MSSLACRACGASVAADAPSPYTCPNAAEGGADHLVVRTLPPSSAFALDGPANPFVRWRGLTHAYALARSRGMTDDAFVAVVADLDARVAEVAGRGFVVMPFGRSEGLSSALGVELPGGIWVKDETGNVSGSHKARHLMGLAILGEVQARCGIGEGSAARLAIASCGNAALGAAVIARAWGRPLDVFIPDDAHPRVVRELQRLSALVHVCAREPGIAGDPCYLAFRRAISAGAVPFCCQGPDNGLCIEGGETLGWEMIAELHREGRALDRLFVQVGGGALASGCVQGYEDAARAGVAVALPRLHLVQTEGAFPLRRAWEKVMDRIARRLGLDKGVGDARLAEAVRARAGAPEIEEELAYAVRHRAEFMWAWESAPKSIAHGILDDETYDWFAIVKATITSGGYPVVVSEERLAEAHRVGRERTGIDVEPTGSAGLAGLLELHARGDLGAREAMAVLFTGVTR